MFLSTFRKFEFINKIQIEIRYPYLEDLISVKDIKPFIALTFFGANQEFHGCRRHYIFKNNNNKKQHKLKIYKSNLIYLYFHSYKNGP